MSRVVKLSQVGQVSQPQREIGRPSTDWASMTKSDSKDQEDGHWCFELERQEKREERREMTSYLVKSASRTTKLWELKDSFGSFRECG